MKRLFAAVATGSVLFAGSFGFAQFQAFASPGLAAQGSAFTLACAPDLNVIYVQTSGVVTGVMVNQIGGEDCNEKPVNVKLYSPTDVLLGSGNGEVNGPAIAIAPGISDVVSIHRAIVTISDAVAP